MTFDNSGKSGHRAPHNTDWLDKLIDYGVVSGTNWYYRANAFTYSAGRLYTYTDPADWW